MPFGTLSRFPVFVVAVTFSSSRATAVSGTFHMIVSFTALRLAEARSGRGSAAVVLDTIGPPHGFTIGIPPGPLSRPALDPGGAR
jgi:hypothetical protein